MTDAMIPAHVRRFANLVNRPGGQTAEEAIGAASTNLATIRDKLVGAIDTTLMRMQALGATLQAGHDPAVTQELYNLANTIIGLAGTAGLGSLGEVSYSLCELIDRLRTGQDLECAGDSVPSGHPAPPAGRRPGRPGGHASG